MRMPRPNAKMQSMHHSKRGKSPAKSTRSAACLTEPPKPNPTDHEIKVIDENDQMREQQ